MFFNSLTELFSRGFPSENRKTVENVVSLIPRATYNDVGIYTSENDVSYFIHNGTITFPYRIYLLEPENKAINKLNDTEKLILHCIYSRSCDGYARQKHIKALLSADFLNWTIPYIVKVCDEYVIEILQMVYDNLKDKNTEVFKDFCYDDRKSFCRSYSRMHSYWNEYYRSDYYKFEEYIGYKLFVECFGAKRIMNCINWS